MLFILNLVFSLKLANHSLVPVASDRRQSMAHAAGYVMYEVGDVVMPADIHDHRVVQEGTGFKQITPRFEVVEIEEAERGTDLSRHYHPQRIRIRVISTSGEKLIWVSGNTVSFPPKEMYPGKPT